MKYLAKIVPNKMMKLSSQTIDLYIKDGGQVLGYKLNGKVFDCGDKLGYSIANIEFSKSDPEIGISLKNILKIVLKIFNKLSSFLKKKDILYIDSEED